ncbi:transcription factor Pcc1 [Botrytis cinerea]
MSTELEFPCTLTLDIPLPTARLASAALSALSVDTELSPLVRRTFSLIAPSPPPPNPSSAPPTAQPPTACCGSQSTVSWRAYP